MFNLSIFHFIERGDKIELCKTTHLKSDEHLMLTEPAAHSSELILNYHKTQESRIHFGEWLEIRFGLKRFDNSTDNLWSGERSSVMVFLISIFNAFW